MSAPIETPLIGYWENWKIWDPAVGKEGRIIKDKFDEHIKPYDIVVWAFALFSEQWWPGDPGASLKDLRLSQCGGNIPSSCSRDQPCVNFAYPNCKAQIPNEYRPALWFNPRCVKTQYPKSNIFDQKNIDLWTNVIMIDDNVAPWNQRPAIFGTASQSNYRDFERNPGYFPKKQSGSPVHDVTHSTVDWGEFYAVFGVNPFMMIVDFRQNCHRNGKKAIVSIGGWTDCVNFKNKRYAGEYARLITKLIQYAHLDGVDFDIEHIPILEDGSKSRSKSSRDTVIDTLYEITKQVRQKNKNKIISITLPFNGYRQISDKPYPSDGIIPIIQTRHKDFLDNFTYINLMTYDFDMEHMFPKFSQCCNARTQCPVSLQYYLLTHSIMRTIKTIPERFKQKTNIGIEYGKFAGGSPIDFTAVYKYYSTSLKRFYTSLFADFGIIFWPINDDELFGRDGIVTDLVHFIINPEGPLSLTYVCENICGQSICTNPPDGPNTAFVDGENYPSYDCEGKCKFDEYGSFTKCNSPGNPCVPATAEDPARKYKNGIICDDICINNAGGKYSCDDEGNCVDISGRKAITISIISSVALVISLIVIYIIRRRRRNK